MCWTLDFEIGGDVYGLAHMIMVASAGWGMGMPDD
jgi:hypothetical protein